MTSAEHALSLVVDGQVLGLGTGRAATEFIKALGERVQQGLRIRGVPTSQASADLATKLGIPLTTLADVEELDLAFDGADEVNPQMRLIKGYGGALVREKIVAAAARRFVVLVGTEKLVQQLGQRGLLPVEVVPFAVPLVQRRLATMDLSGVVRPGFVSDNGNSIIDVHTGPIADPLAFEQQLWNIPGVVDTGLFLAMTDTVLIQHADRVEVRQKT